MILASQIAHSSKKCEIKCESRKKLTTQYKFCLMHVDANCPGGGAGSMRKPADKGGLKIDKILRTSFMDSP